MVGICSAVWFICLKAKGSVRSPRYLLWGPSGCALPNVVVLVPMLSVPSEVTGKLTYLVRYHSHLWELAVRSDQRIGFLCQELQSSLD